MDPGSHQDQVCPRVTYDCGNRTVESLAGSLAACCILVGSSAMSCLGAILILISYAVLKDIRKGAQTIITVLALADLVYSISLIVAGINYFAYYKETALENCEVYQIIILQDTRICNPAWVLGYICLDFSPGILLLHAVCFQCCIIGYETDAFV